MFSGKMEVNPFQPSVAFHIETSHLFCSAKQTTGFYMECNTRLKWVNLFSQIRFTFEVKFDNL